MLLAIDIGNTSIHAGLFKGRVLRRQFILPTRLARSATTLKRKLRASGVQKAIVCSVVPWATTAVTRALREIGIKPVVIGRGIRVPLINHYRYPRQVGQDRLVGAYAAWCEFGGGASRKRSARRNPERGRQAESRDCIVVDIGTAITIDVVTKKGEYLGGVIAPGIGISLEALAARTALLPKVALREPPELLGRDTANSIRSGLLYGCVALCDGLVTRLRRRYAPGAVVVATGGSSALIAKHARTINHLKPHLVLEGLYQLSLK